MGNLIWIMFVFFQTPTEPLPAIPTAWQTPTPEPTLELSVQESNDLIATAQATQFTFTAEGDDVQFNNESIIPTVQTDDAVILFGYFKWVISSGSASVLGPFAPLMIPIGILVSLGFISLFVYFWENVVVTILKIVGFTINTILRFFGR